MADGTGAVVDDCVTPTGAAALPEETALSLAFMAAILAEASTLTLLDADVVVGGCAGAEGGCVLVPTLAFSAASLSAIEDFLRSSSVTAAWFEAPFVAPGAGDPLFDRGRLLSPFSRFPSGGGRFSTMSGTSGLNDEHPQAEQDEENEM